MSDTESGHRDGVRADGPVVHHVPQVEKGLYRGPGPGQRGIQDNVFGALAEPVIGTALSNLLFLAVLASSAASLMTTFLPTTRTMLGMATYRALPARFARIHPST